jgi:hypothetical protein
MALVRVLVALAAVRRSIEAANSELTDAQLVGFVSRLVCAAFDIDANPVIESLQ